MNKCFVCKNEIPDSHPRFTFAAKHTSICMGCEGAKIPVYRVSILYDNTGYYDCDFESVMEGLRHMEVDDAFEIHLEEMSAAKYLSLPEFTGF